MKAAPTGLAMLLNDRFKHIFCPSLQRLSQGVITELIVLTTAVHAPGRKAATTTPNSHPADKLCSPETTPGRVNPISGATVDVKFTQTSHVVATESPSLWFSKLGTASGSPRGFVKAQGALTAVSDSEGLGSGARKFALLINSQGILPVLEAY